ITDYNCRHSAYPIILGVTKPSYTEEQLRSLDPPPFSYEGRQYTAYEAQQQMRKMERAMRRQKDRCIVADAVGDKDAFTAASIKLRRQKDYYEDFCKAAGTYTEYERTFVSGYNRHLAGKTGAVTRKQNAFKNAQITLTNDGNGGIIKKETFTPADSISKAEDFARDVLKIPNVSYKGVDVKTANEWNRGLFDTFSKFPELQDKFGFVGECHQRNEALKPLVQKYYTDTYISKFPDVDLKTLQPYIDKSVDSQMKKLSIGRNTLAQSFSPSIDDYKAFSGIAVNRDIGKNSSVFIDTLKKDVLSKFHPEGCDTIRSVLDHEIGHQLDDLLGIGDLKDIQELYTSRTMKELTDGLSEYAWNNKNKNDFSEMIAEGWAEYCNNPNPREIAKKIGETIEAEYKKQFGKPK
ncbi:MAG: phage minor capsid protein, partial [Ruminococcus sp.]|nr:phage minor capsid protein [Ruminococcus sp.]